MTALSAWRLEKLADDGKLLVTELVANAVKHTNSRSIRVVISRPSTRYVRIAVVDTSRTMPEIPEVNGSDGEDGDLSLKDVSLGGRGLILVDALSERWGTDLFPWGKRVWGELSCETEPHAGRCSPTEPGHPSPR
ncbi:ATP-binding protein [Streptomyces sp. NPDC004610]|uniref:ATP-binding protein n=1 Tax=unclassified Streptomyces TaxID=2593676 RepID=UPI0033AFBEF4